VAAAERVCAGERDNVPIVEAHAVEDVAKVLRPLRGVGKPADDWARLAGLGVSPAEVMLELRATGLLYGTAARKSPDVRVRQLRKFPLDWCEDVALNAKAGVCPVC